MKHLIDINRLNYLVERGQNSYSDGREEFEYELLCDLMRRLKVKIFNAHEKPRQHRKYYQRAMSWHTTHEWQIQVVSNYNWATDELEDNNEDEPRDAGIHVYSKHPTSKEILSDWRRTRRRKNPHETWSIKIVRKIQPKLP